MEPKRFAPEQKEVLESMRKDVLKKREAKSNLWFCIILAFSIILAFCIVAGVYILMSEFLI